MWDDIKILLLALLALLILSFLMSYGVATELKKYSSAEIALLEFKLGGKLYIQIPLENNKIKYTLPLPNTEN